MTYPFTTTELKDIEMVAEVNVEDAERVLLELLAVREFLSPDVSSDTL